MAFRSKNYGGILQAYALTRYLAKRGCAGEIIRYDYSSSKKETTALERWKNASFPEKAAKLFRRLKNIPIRLAKKTGGRFNQRNFTLRDKAFAEFHRTHMRYSEKIASWKTIGGCVRDYDLFITGSDQVWNQGWINGVFLLDFVPPGKAKLSYAASIAQDEIPDEQRAMLRASLKGYRAVSVREQKAVEQLRDMHIDSELVLDPTLLLTRDEWNSLCSSRRIDGDYIFCYFLGTFPAMRKLASKFAGKHHLKIATLPHILGECRHCDLKFGDYKLYDVSPADFLSLIRYAKYVFTDSFHGCVFSFLYQKQFFAFERIDPCCFGMSSRMDTLMKIFHTEPHFCNTKEKTSLRYLESVPEIRYADAPQTLREMKKRSMDFLDKNIG